MRIFARNFGTNYRSKRIFARNFGTNYRSKRIFARKFASTTTIGIAKIRRIFCELSRWRKIRHFSSKSPEIRAFRQITFSLLFHNTVPIVGWTSSALGTSTEINNRPLTVETISDPHLAPPLSPSVLLTGKTRLVLPPPGESKREDLYCRKMWWRTQHMAQEFWSRWSKEYLQQLQARNKWIRPRRNFQVRDVVLLKENQSPRNRWPMAKVTMNDHRGVPQQLIKVWLGW